MAGNATLGALRWKINRLAPIAAAQIDDHHPLADSAVFFRWRAFGCNCFVARTGTPPQIRSSSPDGAACAGRCSNLEKTAPTEAPFTRVLFRFQPLSLTDAATATDAAPVPLRLSGPINLIYFENIYYRLYFRKLAIAALPTSCKCNSGKQGVTNMRIISQTCELVVK